MSSSALKRAAEPARPRRLVLFDIDGTILWTDGAGPRAVFVALEERDDVVLGLLTGNIELGARAKLSAVGIALERFVVGAYGSDHHHRPELPEIARRRAEQALGHPIDGRDVVVIGDTPADVA